MTEVGRIAIFPVGVTRTDLVWGGVGALVGAALYAVLWPLAPVRFGDEVAGHQMFASLLALLAFGGLGFFSVVLSLLDARERRLPNGLLLWGNAWVIALLSFSSLFAGDHRQLRLAWVCAVVFGALVFLMWLRWRFHLGAGDVKLMPMAAFAAIWGSSGNEFFSAVATFPLVMFVGMLLFAVIAGVSGRTDAPAAPIILGASWLTVVIHSEALIELLNR